MVEVYFAASIIRAMVLKVQAVQTSETLVYLYQSTRSYNTDDSHIRTHCSENFKSYFRSASVTECAIIRREEGAHSQGHSRDGRKEVKQVSDWIKAEHFYVIAGEGIFDSVNVIPCNSGSVALGTEIYGWYFVK
jgi:hypothetical protein